MRIKVIVGTSLRPLVEGLKDGRASIELKAGTRLSGLLDHLGLTPELVRSVLVNRSPVRSDVVLQESDRVGLFPADCNAINEISIYYHQPLRKAGPGNP